MLSNDLPDSRCSAADFEHPDIDRHCDLVMKGGITSGVVYPAAILELAKRYRFRGIGGASAGAIAAAGAAAAEFRRASGAPTDILDGSGFLHLGRLSTHLSQPGALLRLFRPARTTRGLFQIFLDILDGVPAPLRILHFLIVPALLIVSLATAGPLLYLHAAKWQNIMNWVLPASIAMVFGFGVLTLWNGWFRRKVRSASPSWHHGWMSWSGIRAVPAYMLTGLAFGVILQSIRDEAGHPLRLMKAPETLAIWMLGSLVTLPLATIVYLLGLWWWRWRLMQNRFGLATGHDPNFCYTPSAADPIDLDAPLTDYLFANFNYLAGLHQPEEVFTFGHLRKADVLKTSVLANGTEGITLRLMTSNLSLKRPYTFPLPDGTFFLFKKGEFEKLFPTQVVEYMIANQPSPLPFPIANPGRDADQLFFLPPSDHLPVILAVRISLSFPGLFSTVPLYALTQAYVAKVRNAESQAISLPELSIEDVRLTHFSDGGIVSNFPINMFDRWFPDAPTFGINLADSLKKDGDRVDESYLVCPRGRDVDRGTPSPDSVHLPRADEMPVAEWESINSITDLASSVFYTAKNHRTNAQTELPGYRERIVTIRLSKHEGGLNLNMPPDAVQVLVSYGMAAGRSLVQSYADQHQLGFRHHQWVRLRVVLAHLEREFRSMKKALESGGIPIEPCVPQSGRPIADLLTSPEIFSGYPFPPPDQNWQVRAFSVLQRLRAILETEFPNDQLVFDESPPRITPEPIKRLVPLEGDV